MTPRICSLKEAYVNVSVFILVYRKTVVSSEIQDQEGISRRAVYSMDGE